MSTPAGVLGVDEVDPGAGRAASWASSYSSRTPCGAQVRGHRLDVDDACRPPAGCPGPLRSRNWPIVESGASGASSWRQEPESPTASIASRTPCSSLTSWCTQRMPKARRVEVDRGVEVGDGDADVVDPGDEGGGQRFHPPIVSAARRRAPGTSVPTGVRAWLGWPQVRYPACWRPRHVREPVRHRRRGPHPDGPPARLAQGLLRPPTSAASPSRPPSSGPASRPTRSTT